MPLTRGQPLGYDNERMAFKFTMLDPTGVILHACFRPSESRRPARAWRSQRMNAPRRTNRARARLRDEAAAHIKRPGNEPQRIIVAHIPAPDKPKTSPEKTNTSKVDSVHGVRMWITPLISLPRAKYSRLFNGL
jgi:hypothetical protein